MSRDSRQIVLATDFMQSSRIALDYAAALANKLKGQLTIVHAFELDTTASDIEIVQNIPSRSRQEAQTRLLDFAAHCAKSGVAVRTLLLEDAPQKAILKAAQQAGADLLVLGTRGVQRKVEHFLLGSNTEALIFKSPCPILTVGPHVPADVPVDAPFQKLIYVTNLRPASVAAAPHVARFSAELGIEIEIFHVAKDLLDEEAGSESKQRIEKFCEELKKNPADIPPEWFSPEFHQHRLIVSQEILQKAKDPRALMVVGVPKLSSLQRHLHTSYPYRLLANAACPILSIRNSVA